MSLLQRILGHSPRQEPLERREPLMQTNGFSIVSGSTRNPPQRGTRELLIAYRKSPVLKAVASKIAGAVASAKWSVKTSTFMGESIEIDNHPMALMLNRGVPGLTGLQCRKIGVIHHLIAGEMFSVMDRNIMGKPVRRWPVPPHWLSETPLPGRPYFDVVPRNGGTPQRFHVDDVIWHKDPDAYDPYGRGSGVGRSLADELTADEAAAQFMSSALLNRARPDMVISGTKDAPFQKEDVARIESIWNQRFGGPTNTGRPFISSQPLNVTPVTPTFQELQLLGMREWERNIIIHVFGVPPEIAGIMENTNRATAETAEFIFSKHVVKPILVDQASTYNDQVAPQYGESIEAFFEDPVDRDEEFRSKIFQQRPDAFTIDEHRELAGMDPLPDGRGQVFPTGFTTQYLEELGSLTPERVAGDDEDESQDVEERSAHIVTKASDSDIDAAVDAVGPGLFESILRASVAGAAEEFARNAGLELDVDIAFDLADPGVADFLTRTALERSEIITETTRKKLRKTLTEGVTAGESTDNLVKRIQASVFDAGKARARTISRTEILRAANFGTTEAHKQAGIEEQRWLATRDENTRDTHRSMDGQVVGVLESFTSPSGATAQYPGDFGVAAEDINCRCTVIPVIDIPEERAVQIWKMFDRRLLPHERVLEQQANAAFEAQAQAAIAALTSGVQGR